MNVDVSIKLPPVLLQPFSININEAKCIKCNISCALVEEDILFHLSVCNGNLIEENIQTLLKFNCLKCNFSTHNIDQWKRHLFKLDHISNNFDLDKIRYSYNCDLCNTHFYGFRDSILKHHCKPRFISSLSDLMAFVYMQHNIQNKQTMLHYCTDCSFFTYDLTTLHLKKHSEVADISVCHSCLITFYGSSKEEFLNHKVSFEHMILWFLNGARSAPEMSTSALQNLPYYITKYFVISPLLEKCCCIVCNTKKILSYECIYDHFYNCISSKEITDFNGCIPLLSLNCNLCNYSCFGADDMYKCWVDHVISLDHLTKTVVGKKDKQKLFSYYCYVSETAFYGSDSFIKNLILKTNYDIGRLLFVSDLMATVYKHVTNTHFSSSILFCCGICQNHKVNQFDCVHKNNDSNLSLYCFTCLIVFNVKSDYYEHLVSSEHIILKYFKSNQLAELKILDHSMETMKIYLTNLNKSDDDDTDNPEETISQDNYEIITSTQNLTYCDSKENIIRKLIERLSAHPMKSAFTNYLRMHFDLLIREPQASNNIVISTVYFCEVCNTVLCSRDSWIKHDKNVHSKDMNLWVLFCDICCFYHVSAQINFTHHHIMTLEHLIMEVFQNQIKRSTNNINNCIKNSNHANDNKDSDFNIEIKEEKNPNEYIRNKSMYIEIKSKYYFKLYTYFIRLKTFKLNKFLIFNF